jgi:hypothetical protein
MKMEKKNNSKRSSTVDTQTVTEELRVELTTEEKVRLGARASDLYARLSDVEDELKAYQAEKKAEIKRLNSDIREALLATRTGYELRPISVFVEVHWKTGLLRKIRADTRVCYFERTLRPEERQRSMFNEIVRAAADELDEPPDEPEKPGDDQEGPKK